jgi:hypothetical protein
MTRARKITRAVKAPLSPVAAVVGLAVLGLVLLGPRAVDGVLALLTLWALRDRVSALQALELSVLVKYMNPGLVAYDEFSGVLMWAVILAAAARVCAGASAVHWQRVVPVIGFVALALVFSIAVSPAVEISVMKLLTFGIIVSTVIMAADGLTEEQRADFARWLLTLGLVAIGASALTLLRPEIAFRLNGTGLQGIFNHPQSLGTFTAPFAAVLLAQALVLQRRAGLVWLAAIALCWSVMLLTEARTAAFAAAAGVGSALAARLWWGRQARSDVGPGRIFGVLAIVAVALVVAIVQTDAVGRAVTSFLLKRSGEQEVSAALHASRGVGIEGQWRNFLDAPLTGHGFGVYVDGTFPDGVSRVWGIPISAPVEKGFVPTAVLEETGLPGALLFATLIGSLWLTVWRSREPQRIALFVGALAVNVGEAVILSPGGIGLHVWILLALASGRVARPSRAAQPVASAPALLPRFPHLMR